MFTLFCSHLLDRKDFGKQYNDDFWKIHSEIKKSTKTIPTILQVRGTIKFIFDSEKTAPMIEIQGVHTKMCNLCDAFTCGDTFQSDSVLNVMRDIFSHLKSKDVLKIEKALSFLHVLLLSGPESVLSASLDVFEIIRFFLHCRLSPLSSSGVCLTDATLTFSCQQIISKSRAILHILLDMQRLMEQRKWSQLWRLGAFPHMRYKPIKSHRVSRRTEEFSFSLRNLHEEMLPTCLNSLIRQETGINFNRGKWIYCHKICNPIIVVRRSSNSECIKLLELQF
jgi:hypothetical protein